MNARLKCSSHVSILYSIAKLKKNVQQYSIKLLEPNDRRLQHRLQTSVALMKTDLQELQHALNLIERDLKRDFWRDYVIFAEKYLQRDTIRYYDDTKSFIYKDVMIIPRFVILDCESSIIPRTLEYAYYYSVSSADVARFFKWRYAIARLRRNVLFITAIRKWVNALWKPGGAMSQRGWEACSDILKKV